MSDTKRAKIAERMAAWGAKMRARGSQMLARSRALRHSTDAKLTTHSVGFGLAAGGGVLALIGIIGILFVPVATFTTLDGELFALFGAILLIVGVIVEAAD